MEIREITPDDPIFQSLKDEQRKIKMPGFMQLRDKRPVYKAAPPVPTPPPPVPQKPIVQPPTQKAARPDWLMQKRPVPQPIPFSEPSVLISPEPAPAVVIPAYLRKPVVVPVPAQKPIEPPPIVQQPQPIPQPVYVPDPIYQPPMSTAEIYGTGKPRGFKMPSLFHRKPKPEPVMDELYLQPETHRFSLRSLSGPIAQAAVGLIVIFFGLTSTGSYYESSSRFSGILAQVFYQWQLGTMIAIFGSLMIYDAIKKAGNL
jgi:hypothetical protein